MSYYSGSIDDAVNKDAFLLDYSEYLGDMPNYSYILDQYVEAKKTITSSDTGAMVASRRFIGRGRCQRLYGSERLSGCHRLGYSQDL